MNRQNPQTDREKNTVVSANGTHKTRKKTPSLPFTIKLMRLAFGIGGRIAPKFAGNRAYGLWFTPTRFQTPVSEYAALESARIEHHKINGEKIATYHWGQAGAIVLLVHGWSGRGTQMGSFIKPLTDAGYRVLSFDAPAHGNSSGKQTNLYQVTDVILALQKIYGVFDSVITHSFGGPCIALALQRGFKTSRVISISPPASTRGLVEKFIRILNIPEKAGAYLLTRIEDTFGKDIWQEISMKNTVAGINIPAIIFHDDQDKDIPWQEGRDVAAAWNDSSFIKTSGLGHRRILRDSTVIESTLDFITVAA